jgi:GT2 family glycosyltransferase
VTAAQPVTSRPISLCVINYNGELHLDRSLKAVRQSALRFDEVLLVDNASTDASRELVRHCYPEVQLLPLERNDGPAAARNAGFRKAQHDLILFVDNDVAIAPSCAAELRGALTGRKGVLAAMPRVLYADQRDTIQYEGADCHFMGHMAPRQCEKPVTGSPLALVEVNSLITACFLLDRAAWGTTPPFDASFIFNYEDHDLGFRSRILGHTLLAVPSALCLHGSGTPGLSLRQGGPQSPLRVYCLMRNRWRIILQCFAGRTLLLLWPLLALFEVFQLLGCIRKGWFRVWLSAAGWMVAHARLTASGRGNVQAARRTPDRAILQGGDIPFSRSLAQGWVERAACGGLNRLSRAYWRLIEGRL